VLVEPQTNWRARWYYILRNKTTGKCYVGQTVKPNMDSYCGSGKYWVTHCKKHGGHNRQNIEVLEQVWAINEQQATDWLDQFERNNPDYFLRSNSVWANRAKETTNDSAFAGVTAEQRLEYAIAGGLATVINRPNFYSEMGLQQGRRNADSGHMQAIQKIGCVLGGKAVGYKNLQSFVGTEKDLEMRREQGRKVSLIRHKDKDPQSGNSQFAVKIGKRSGETKKLFARFCKQMGIINPGSNFKNVDRSAFAQWRVTNAC